TDLSHSGWQVAYSLRISSSSRIKLLCMKRKRRRESQKQVAARCAELPNHSEKSAEALNWPGEQLRYLWLIGIALIALCTVIIYGQTVRVPPIDYEDPSTWYTVRMST